MAQHTIETEVNIYNPSAIATGIAEAGATATGVITEIGSTGIQIHPTGQTGSGIVDYTQIDENGVSIYSSGVRSGYFFGASNRIGADDASGRVGCPRQTPMVRSGSISIWMLGQQRCQSRKLEPGI